MQYITLFVLINILLPLSLALPVVDEDKIALHNPNKITARHSSAVPVRIDTPTMKARQKHNNNTVYTKVSIGYLHIPYYSVDGHKDGAETVYTF